MANEILTAVVHTVKIGNREIEVLLLEKTGVIGLMGDYGLPITQITKLIHSIFKNIDNLNELKTIIVNEATINKSLIKNSKKTIKFIYLRDIERLLISALNRFVYDNGADNIFIAERAINNIKYNLSIKALDCFIRFFIECFEFIFDKNWYISKDLFHCYKNKFNLSFLTYNDTIPRFHLSTTLDEALKEGKINHPEGWGIDLVNKHFLFLKHNNMLAVYYYRLRELISDLRLEKRMIIEGESFYDDYYYVLHNKLVFFVNTFEYIFHHDWVNTIYLIINSNTVIESGRTFLDPYPPGNDEYKHWYVRGSLLKAYRDLKEAMFRKNLFTEFDKTPDRRDLSLFS